MEVAGPTRAGSTGLVVRFELTLADLDHLRVDRFNRPPVACSRVLRESDDDAITGTDPFHGTVIRLGHFNRHRTSSQKQ
jgi:hypothetical protein